MGLEKINVRSIITNHVNTLWDYGADKRSYSDLLLFFALPVAVAGFAFWRGAQLRAIAVTGLLTASTMFVALLLNLLIMVLAYLRSTEGDPTDQSLQLRKRYLREIAANLSFSILIALSMVGVSITALFQLKKDQDLIGTVPTFCLMAGAAILVLGLLMILRRMYALILDEFDRHRFKPKA
jgi:hypothetical protein